MLPTVTIILKGFMSYPREAMLGLPTQLHARRVGRSVDQQTDLTTITFGYAWNATTRISRK